MNKIPDKTRHSESANLLEGPGGRKLSMSKIWPFGILKLFAFWPPPLLSPASNLGTGSHALVQRLIEFNPRDTRKALGEVSANTLA